MDFTGGITISGGLTITPTTAIAANDPYFMYNSLLLPGNGTNLAQNNTFLDGSTNNFTVTRNGNTTQGTFSPYGSNWSNYFDGTGDYLSAPSNAAFALGTGDFTAECWFYGTTLNASTQQTLINIGGSGGFIFSLYTNKIHIAQAGVVDLTDFTTTLVNNRWYHIAMVKASGSIRAYIDGVQQSTAYSDSTSYTATGITAIGAQFNDTILFTGYISNARVVKGTAVYTSTFTPSTTPLTAIAGTSLLTCQSNRFIDNSTNAFAITVNGNTNIQRFSPFEPTAEYSSSTIGGSGYFDGTGDYLTIARSNLLIPVANENFTIESWVYLTQAADQQIVGFHTQGVSSDWVMSISSTNYPTFYISATATTMTSSIAVRLNTWNHIAVVRTNTNTITLYVNGVAGATTTTTSTMVGNGSNPLTIGSDYNGVTWRYMGYISDIRIVKGTGVYTSAFTPPTAPVTAVANTQLLTNYTNAGIIDNAMMNNLETVGDAKISTTQSKFGGSSMLFDGTGDYLKLKVNDPTLTFGSGDFTIEGWVYLTSTAGNQYFVVGTCDNSTVAGSSFDFGVIGAVGASIYIGGSTYTATAPSPTINTWSHVAYVRNGTSFKTYLNGVQTGTATLPAGGVINAGTTNSGAIGANGTGLAPIFGYIDDLRITKGYARYTSNFTPPTSAFPTY